MAKLAAVVGVLVLGGGVATAGGPTARFGLTFGHDRNDEVPVFGPAIAVGERVGPFVGEIEWAWLSFLEGLTTAGGVQRVGVTLRADLTRSFAGHCKLDGTGLYACTRATSFYGEFGAGERFGQWLTTGVPTPHQVHQPEAHVGFGFEMDNQLHPSRTGWQFGVRFTAARSDPYATAACRGTGCAATSPGMTGPSLDYSVLAEWMYLLGR